MKPLQLVADSLLHFFFPHICSGCGSDSLSKDSSLCIHCLNTLPETGFGMQAGNPIEKKFWGRMPVSFGMAQYYFTSQSLLQKLMH
jgi:predicted amidophosphoribosyltransferase